MERLYESTEQAQTIDARLKFRPRFWYTKRVGNKIVLVYEVSYVAGALLGPQREIRETILGRIVILQSQ